MEYTQTYSAEKAKKFASRFIMQSEVSRESQKVYAKSYSICKIGWEKGFSFDVLLGIFRFATTTRSRRS